MDVLEPSNVVCEASLSASGSATLLSKQQHQQKGDILSDFQQMSVSVADQSNDSQKGAKQHQRQRTYSHVDWSTTLGIKIKPLKRYLT